MHRSHSAQRNLDIVGRLSDRIDPHVRGNERFLDPCQSQGTRCIPKSHIHRLLVYSRDSGARIIPRNVGSIVLSMPNLSESATVSMQLTSLESM